MLSPLERLLQIVTELRKHICCWKWWCGVLDGGASDRQEGLILCNLLTHLTIRPETNGESKDASVMQKPRGGIP